MSPIALLPRPGVHPLLAGVFAFLAPAPPPVAGQSAVVDQGVYRIEVGGEEMGAERFSIRRAGILSDAVYIADAVMTVRSPEGREEARPLLRVRGSDEVPDGYQLKVSGARELEIRMNLAGPRFVSRFSSPRGREEREFRARRGTRILEAGVAHHHYFLRAVEEGDVVHVVVPRERRELELKVTSVTTEEISIGPTVVPARRVALEAPGEGRIVWFGRQGQVLRVEIPSRKWVAVRTDLTG